MKKELDEEEQEILDDLTDVCVAYGTAMRHTMLNHKEKSNAAWAKFAAELFWFVRKVD